MDIYNFLSRNVTYDFDKLQLLFDYIKEFLEYKALRLQFARFTIKLDICTFTTMTFTYISRYLRMYFLISNNIKYRIKNNNNQVRFKWNNNMYKCT